MTWKKRIYSAINTRQQKNMMRIRTTVENGAGPFLLFEGRRYYNFSSNDYLGLSQHPAVVHAWKESAEQFGVGSGGSSHVNGYTIAHRKLEETLAQWLGYPRALLFISGFSANQAVIMALTGKSDRILADRLSHASLLEAAKLSEARFHRFSHNDVTSLGNLLKKECNGEKLVITEGIFSMDGDSAPLSAIRDISKKEKAWLMVDDAHGIGVIGNDGRGSCNVEGVHPEILVVTFGKGVGISGAAVLCEEEVAQYLLQFSRHLIYSTSMPPPQAVALQAAIGVIRSEDGEYRRQCLKEHIRIFKKEAKNLKWCLSPSHSGIQAIIVGDNDYALHLSLRLRKMGIWTTAIRPPTVPAGTARLRLTLTSSHNQDDIIILLEALHEVSR